MRLLGFQRPAKLLLRQKVMFRVCYALIPLALASIYLFGWKSLVLILVSLVFGTITEALFTFRQGKPITSAVFVTCLIFSLSLPPALPFWMALVGIIFGVLMGKMVFGGFGHNVFNPAMVGRCFLYVTFPASMTNQWSAPFWRGAGGFSEWSAAIDAVSGATPLVQIRNGVVPSLQDLFFGNVAGSLGETSGVLIILCGAYIIYKKAAPWRLAASCLLGGILLNVLLYGFALKGFPSPFYGLLSGSFLFGTAFVVTEPISGPKTLAGQWIYGFFVGGLTMIFRAFSNFSEGIMFSVLLMNAFVPILDRAVHRFQASKKVVQ